MDFSEVANRLGSIEAKLDRVLDDSKQSDERITALERWQYKVLGFVAACSGIGGFLFALVRHG